MKIEKPSYFKRQMVLQDFGITGQEKLQRSSVAIVGMGGLGNPAAVALALAGVGRLKLIDFDRVDISNLHRQFLYTPADVGCFKTDISKTRLMAMAPFTQIESVTAKLEAQNASDLLTGVDLVLDCTDNFSAKFLIHDITLCLKIPLVQTSIYQYEGQILIFDPGDRSAPCFRCLYPDRIENGCVGNCADVGVLGATAMVFGSLQASVAIEMLLERSDLKQGEVMTFDLRTMDTIRHRFSKNMNCQHCSGKKTLNDIEADDRESPAITLEQALLTPEQYIWVDIREAEEIMDSDYQKLPVKNIQKLCMDKELLNQLSKTQKYIFFCAKGYRSDRLVRQLRMQQMMNVFSLDSGLGPFD